MILSCGENVIDFIPTSYKKNYYKACIGGSPLNTALALGRLNQPVYFFSRVSNDFFGKKIVNFLKQNNVNTSLLQRTEDLTTVAIVSEKKNPQFSFHAAQTADRNLKDYQFNKTLYKKVLLAHFGSISLVLPPGSETYFKLMKKLQNKCIISIDPNIRENLISNKNSFIKRFNKFLNLADIIKLSEEDMKFINNRKNNDFIIKNWIKKNKVSIVILTKGSLGASLYTDNYKINVKAKKIKVIDTVGAGDSFQAGIISWLNNHNLLKEKKFLKLKKNHWKSCLEHASKIASHCCKNEGCDPPWAKEV
ncbi:MAG: Fructokinase [Alphaproteobacteria bacterium MarineAlpha5_Bin6]|nr:MAG: Fructokinase [Alphaproteobacteria bacterium MarineAlpha5_Bin7]PPR54653.1 MAG: Fructokinase [Alphaproteobacteria bacterium MarineAlpha5_Bin6]|tara:strand:- start:23586 stop:24503 length:918 start_codon:yes stop_codon:yes gene_type:complete